MAISAVYGLPGAGKSYTAVFDFVMPALRSGRRVVTNLPLDLDAVGREVSGAEALLTIVGHEAFVGDQGAELVEPGCVVVVDEAWRVWPANGKVLRGAWATVIAEHRHMTDLEGRPVEIVLVTQAPTQVHSGVRKLVERVYDAKKLGALGARGSYRLTVLDGHGGQTISSAVRRYSPSVYGLYRSHTRGEGGAVDESLVDQRSFWRSPRAYVMYASVVLGLLAVRQVVAYFGGPAAEPREAAGPPKKRDPVPGVAFPDRHEASRVSASAGPARPDGWCHGTRVSSRVAGTLVYGGRAVALLQGSSGIGYVDLARCVGDMPVMCCVLDGGRYAESETAYSATYSSVLPSASFSSSSESSPGNP